MSLTNLVQKTLFFDVFFIYSLANLLMAYDKSNSTKNLKSWFYPLKTIFRTFGEHLLFCNYVLSWVFPCLFARIPDKREKGSTVPYVIKLSDKTFGLNKHLLRPYPSKGLSYEKRIYNYRHYITETGVLLNILSVSWPTNRGHYIYL